MLPKNTTQCPRPGLEPRPLDPESSALTLRPSRLQHCRRAGGKVQDVGESRALSLQPLPTPSHLTHTWIVASNFQIRSRARPTPSTPPTTPRMTASASASLGQTDKRKTKYTGTVSDSHSYILTKRSNRGEIYGRFRIQQNCILCNRKYPRLEK